MANPRLDEVRSWLTTKAREDLEASAWLLKSPSALHGAVGFHCQQAAEKTLKAYLAWQEQPFEKTHSLVALVGMCLKFSSDFDILRNAATTPTPFAVTTRYPGDLPDISAQEAKEAINLARQIWDFVLTHLPNKAHIPL
jgi:HEPN domain-containing protein